MDNGMDHCLVHNPVSDVVDNVVENQHDRKKREMIRGLSYG